MDYPKIANNVLIRHACHCDDAAERPASDAPDEHRFRFEVDGQNFPWYIGEKGPQVTRLADDFWRIDVEILGAFEIAVIASSGRMGEIPVIGDLAFPWLMTEDGWTLTAGHKQLPTVRLGFLAHDVDTNTPVLDLREQWVDREIIGNGGDIWRDGKQHCTWCDTLVDNLWDHIPEAHPEYVSSRGIRVS